MYCHSRLSVYKHQWRDDREINDWDNLINKPLTHSLSVCICLSVSVSVCNLQATWSLWNVLRSPVRSTSTKVFRISVSNTTCHSSWHWPFSHKVILSLLLLLLVLLLLLLFLLLIFILLLLFLLLLLFFFLLSFCFCSSCSYFFYFCCSFSPSLPFPYSFPSCLCCYYCNFSFSFFSSCWPAPAPPLATTTTVTVTNNWDFDCLPPPLPLMLLAIVLYFTQYRGLLRSWRHHYYQCWSSLLVLVVCACPGSGQVLHTVSSGTFALILQLSD